MSLRAGWMSLLGLVLILGLSACSTSKNQNPVASEEEVGKVADESFVPGDALPTHYTAKSGDTLRKIAGRPEIYGDPNLWPLLQEANAAKVGQSMKVNKGVRLEIPRDASDEQKEMAREKARQLASANKMSEAPAKKPSKTAVAAETAVASSSSSATPVPAQPVPAAKKGGKLLPVLFVLLLILAALAALLFYFMKKEDKDKNQG
jgi:hypothetical protein